MTMLSQFKNHVEILSWNELNNVDEQNLTVLSTIYPNFNYNIYNKNINIKTKVPVL